ncbi:hypothetical protein GCM10010531_27820 [Blastococcus jejuensis]|uniref:Uncharacterized protein n=1 Tax=Blastococcus jejuensis TaxID=351224 RepID=A0ABP6PAE7_9ACTN
MTAHYCPDCGLFEVSVRKPGKDGRCDWCRAQVGKRRPRTTVGKRQPLEPFEYLLTEDRPR